MIREKKNITITHINFIAREMKNERLEKTFLAFLVEHM